MHPFLKNPLAVLSALCWFVMACLALSVLLNTRTIEGIDAAQRRAQSEQEALKQQLAQARQETAQAARVIARDTIEIEQRHAGDIEQLRKSLADLDAEVKSLRRAVDENRDAAEKSSAELQAAFARTKPVTFADARSVPSAGGMHINGNGGRDIMNGWESLLYLDGSRLVSLEIFNLADGRRNEVRVMAPGLNDLEDDFMELRLDPKLDSVQLDRCLQWKKDDAPIPDAVQKQFTTAPGAYIWTATDADGKTRRIAITAGADVKIGDTCENDYSAQVAARDAREKAAPKPPRQQEQPARPYHPDAKEIAGLYDSWAKELADPDMRKGLSLLAAAVRDGKLPPEFISGLPARDMYAVRQLSFSPAESVQQKIDENFDCAASRRSAGAGTLLLTGNDVTAQCGDGNHVFALGKRDDHVSMTAGGQNIFIPGKGNDTIDAGRGSSIVILDKNWGSKKITTTCAVPGATYADKMFRIKWHPRLFGGIGARLIQDGDRILVNSLVPGSPAEKAGIRAGDYLVSANDQPLLSGLEAAINLIRGPAGITVAIEIERDHERRTMNVRRESINAAATPETGAAVPERIDYKWPYQYEDFILFGPGIARVDLIEDETGKWRNTKTGDRLEISPCFNFVFSE